MTEYYNFRRYRVFLDLDNDIWVFKIGWFSGKLSHEKIFDGDFYSVEKDGIMYLIKDKDESKECLLK